MADPPKISGSVHKSLAEDARDDIAEARNRLANLLKTVRALSENSGKPIPWHKDHTIEIGLIMNLLMEAEVKQTEQLEIINSEFRKRGRQDNILEWKDGTDD